MSCVVVGGFYGIQPYGMMVPTPGSESSSSHQNGVFMATLKIPSPRDAFFVLHRAATTLSRIENIYMVSQNTSNQAGASITISDRKLYLKLTGMSTKRLYKNCWVSISTSSSVMNTLKHGKQSRELPEDPLPDLKYCKP